MCVCGHNYTIGMHFQVGLLDIMCQSKHTCLNRLTHNLFILNIFKLGMCVKKVPIAETIACVRHSDLYNCVMSAHYHVLKGNKVYSKASLVLFN